MSGMNWTRVRWEKRVTEQGAIARRVFASRDSDGWNRVLVLSRGDVIQETRFLITDTGMKVFLPPESEVVRTESGELARDPDGKILRKRPDPVPKMVPLGSVCGGMIIGPGHATVFVQNRSCLYITRSRLAEVIRYLLDIGPERADAEISRAARGG